MLSVCIIDYIMLILLG